jgi:hypothetical protein
MADLDLYKVIVVSENSSRPQFPGRGVQFVPSVFGRKREQAD